MTDTQTDTRNFRSHAAWCNHLFSRGVLAVPHRNCRLADECVNADAKSAGRKYTRDQRAREAVRDLQAHSRDLRQEGVNA